MDSSDPISKALRDYEAKVEEKQKSEWHTCVLATRRRRLRGAFEAAAHYNNSDKPATEIEDPTHDAFARRWTRRWLHAARVLRRYGDPLVVLNMTLPDDPIYIVAREMFRTVLEGKVANGAEQDAFAEELARLIRKLRDGRDDHPLREFFLSAEEAVATSWRIAGDDDKAAITSEPSGCFLASQVGITIVDQERVVARYPDGTSKQVSEKDLGRANLILLVEFASAQGTLTVLDGDSKGRQVRKLRAALHRLLRLQDSPIVSGANKVYLSGFKSLTIAVSRIQR